MLRRGVRLRREFLEVKERESLVKRGIEKKKQLKQAIEEGKVPTELREFEKTAGQKLDLLIDPILDDEYALAGFKKPQLLMTTSRSPSNRLKQFAKELSILFPNTTRVNRGTQVLSEIMTSAQNGAFTDVIIVHESHGTPDSMIVSHLPHGPTAYFTLSEVALRHDMNQALDPIPEVCPHLIFNNFTTTLGARVQNILGHLFPPPGLVSRRSVSFLHSNSCIIFRHHRWTQEGPGRMHRRKDVEDQKAKKPTNVELFELGPRFTMRLYKLTLGTIDMKQAPVEWALRPFMNKQKIYM